MSFDYVVDDRIEGTPYEVTRCIAAGGMGAVYEVVDTTIGKPFVLKTLKAAVERDGVAEQRMAEEAKTLGRLTHPNIVQVFTAGVTHDALRLPYIVMERLVGCTLHQVIQKHPAGLGLRQATVIALELLSALRDPHDFGLVHRDIKPANVFLHRAKRNERRTKLLDFGLAELVATMKPDASDRFSGTVRYASPEQLAGQPLTLRSDLYSVAVVVYEMLTGRFLFPHAKGTREVALAHHTDLPPLPGSWPAAVRVVIGSALGKLPEHRPPDALTFLKELRSAMRDAGVGVQGPLLEEELFDPGDPGLAHDAPVPRKEADQRTQDDVALAAATQAEQTAVLAKRPEEDAVVEDTAPNSRPLWRG